MQCENPFCAEVLSADHVTLITTAHVRRFCSVECLIESYYHHRDVLAEYTTHGVRGPSTPPESNVDQDGLTAEEIMELEAFERNAAQDSAVADMELEAFERGVALGRVGENALRLLKRKSLAGDQ